jgi:hypothetical protein
MQNPYRCAILSIANQSVLTARRRITHELFSSLDVEARATPGVRQHLGSLLHLRRNVSYNKFDVLNKVVSSNLGAENKCLLFELVLRSDGNWYSFPSVQRLARARGMKHEKNFKGADFYLPGLVTTSRKGRKNGYTLNVEAIMALDDLDVTIKHTPAPGAPAETGSHTPAQADDAPDGADDVPADGGANSSENTSKNNSVDSSLDGEPALRATSPSPVTSNLEEPSVSINSPLDDWETWEAPLSSTTRRRIPARAGVSSGSIDEDW